MHWQTAWNQKPSMDGSKKSGHAWKSSKYLRMHNSTHQIGEVSRIPRYKIIFNLPLIDWCPTKSVTQMTITVARKVYHHFSLCVSLEPVKEDITLTVTIIFHDKPQECEVRSVWNPRTRVQEQFVNPFDNSRMHYCRLRDLLRITITDVTVLHKEQCSYPYYNVPTSFRTCLCPAFTHAQVYPYHTLGCMHLRIM